jgi:hypothetical protein
MRPFVIDASGTNESVSNLLSVRVNVNPTGSPFGLGRNIQNMDIENVSRFLERLEPVDIVFVIRNG